MAGPAELSKPPWKQISRNYTARKHAKLIGATRYITGIPCLHGHLSERQTANGKCLECATIERRKQDPDIRRKRLQDWRQSNPVSVRASEQKYRRKILGLPVPTRPMPETCEVCGNKSRDGRSLSLDHCHTTGRFRGWLCNSCNLGLGLIGDSMAAVERLHVYLAHR